MQQPLAFAMLVHTYHHFWNLELFQKICPHMLFIRFSMHMEILNPTISSFLLFVFWSHHSLIPTFPSFLSALIFLIVNPLLGYSFTIQATPTSCFPFWVVPIFSSHFYLIYYFIYTPYLLLFFSLHYINPFFSCFFSLSIQFQNFLLWLLLSPCQTHMWRKLRDGGSIWEIGSMVEVFISHQSRLVNDQAQNFKEILILMLDLAHLVVMSVVYVRWSVVFNC